MDLELQKLILSNLQEVADISRTNQMKLERLDVLLETIKERQKADDATAKKDIHIIQERLTKLESFQIKIIVMASTVALVITLLWDVVGKFVVPIFS